MPYSREELAVIVSDAVARVLRGQTVTRSVLPPETYLADLGLDSLDVIEVILDIEDRVDAMLPDGVEDSGTVGGLVECIWRSL